jgi:iron complex outermembrane receptor protein
MSARSPTASRTRRARPGWSARCTVTPTSYTYVNLQTGARFGRTTATLYGENLGNSGATTYIHPEAFVYSRFAIVRPRTFGVRLGYNL